MIESINSSQGVNYIQNNNYSRAPGSLLDFSSEDQAIISAQAKILNELEKFNAGAGNEVELALASTMGKIQVKAAVSVINAKGEMVDAVMEMID